LTQITFNIAKFKRGLVDLYDAEEVDFKKEKNKARELRKTQWWKRKCAKGICYYCHEKIKPQDLTMDHIVPLSRGGRSVKGNVAPACKECNNNKKQKLPYEWNDYLKNLEQQGR
jgi:5-methylcytosine-specific restriction enzyme A